jgi:hypothetical protein
MTTSLSSLPFTFGANKPNSSLANSSPNRLSRLWGTLISERGFSLLSGQAIYAGPFFKSAATPGHHSVTTLRTKLASVWFGTLTGT